MTEELQFSIAGELRTPKYDCTNYVQYDERGREPFEELGKLYPIDGTPAEQLQTLIARLHSLQYARSRAFGDDPRDVRSATLTVQARETFNRLTVQINLFECEVELVKAAL